MFGFYDVLKYVTKSCTNNNTYSKTSGFYLSQLIVDA